MVIKNYNLLIFPSAALDMEQIFSYIANELNNPSAAVKLINAFEKAFDYICYFPESYPFINNPYVKDKTLRKLIVENYIVFYRIKSTQIEIIRILYGMCNYIELL